MTRPGATDTQPGKPGENATMSEHNAQVSEKLAKVYYRQG
jgi:hypothetical protein